MTTRRQRLVGAVLSFIFIAVGILHFTRTDAFAANMPPYIPYARALVLVSGVFEILGVLGIWAPWPRIRVLAGYGIVALLLSVYIVNIDMALHGSPLRDGTVVPGGDLTLWLRLPFQLVMIWMALYATRTSRSEPG